MRVVVMNNLFQNQSGLAMHRRYDLKGSTQARRCSFCDVSTCRAGRLESVQPLCRRAAL